MWLSSKEEMPESVVPMAKPPGALLATFPMSGPTFCIPPALRDPLPSQDRPARRAGGWQGMDWNAPSGKCLNPALGRLGMLMSVHEGWIAQRPPISCSQLLAHGYMPLGAIFLYDFDEHLSNRFTFQMHPSCIGPF